MWKKRSKISGIRSKDGKLLIEKGKIVNRWQERFREVLNVPTEASEGCTDQANTDIEIETSPIREEQVKKNFKIKNGKSPGIDNISTELLKENVVPTAPNLRY